MLYVLQFVLQRVAVYMHSDDCVAVCDAVYVHSDVCVAACDVVHVHSDV